MHLMQNSSGKMESVPYDTIISSSSVPPWSFAWLLCFLVRRYNVLRRLLVPTKKPHLSTFKALAEIQELATIPTDINEHVELIFDEALLLRPKLIVELGVRGGTSTFVFERAAALNDAYIISVDIDDCSSISSYPRWHFYRGDDVDFALHFDEFCKSRNIAPRVDLLFIDTSHYYEHTLRELQAWVPLLSPNAKIMLHDTNLRLIGPRKDGCFAVSYSNKRGVIRAVEEYFAVQIDETRESTAYAGGWLIRHRPDCNGFTVIDRVLPSER